MDVGRYRSISTSSSLVRRARLGLNRRQSTRTRKGSAGVLCASTCALVPLRKFRIIIYVKI